MNRDFRLTHSATIKHLFQSGFFDTSEWQSTCAVTLTMKQTLYSDGFPIGIDQWQCSRSFKHFMNLLNRQVYGKAFYRHYKRLRVIPVLEKSAIGPYHWHITLERPSHVSESKFKFLINDTWAKVHWANKQTDIVINCDGGWSWYILKQQQKDGLETWLDCIDWECFFNPIADV